ncbi:hypothetical protein MOTC310_24080 [Methylobacterium oryzae]|uniref:Uncharacterized protein n=1 Tax=Methylobacterium oryzae TaxID=334852 RepID=A0ABU7TVM3_9HYPH
MLEMVLLQDGVTPAIDESFSGRSMTSFRKGLGSHLIGAPTAAGRMRGARPRPNAIGLEARAGEFVARPHVEGERRDDGSDTRLPMEWDAEQFLKRPVVRLE